MHRLLTFLLCATSALAFTANAQNTQTTLNGSGGAGASGSGPTSCPKAVDPSSLCANAPVGTFTATEASLRQSGQTWTVTANYNRPALDFAIGPDTPVGSAIDVASTAGLNALSAIGCTFNATGGSSGGAIIVCNAQASLNISHSPSLNFFSTSLNKCVPLDIKAGQTGSVITIKNNYFKGDGPGNGCGGNSYPGFGPILIFAENPSTIGLDFESNEFDGLKDTTLTCTEFGIGGGAITLKYNVGLHCNTQPILIPNTTAPTSITSQANFVEGMIYVVSAHGEWWADFFKPAGIGGSGSGATGAWASTDDVVVTDSDNAVSGTTADIYGEADNSTCQPASTNACTWTSFSVAYGFLVSNLNGGSSPISRAIDFGSGNYGAESITNTLIDPTGLIGGNNYYAVGGKASTSWNTHGTTTVDNVASNNLTSSNIGQYVTDLAGDIPAGSFIVAVNSSSSFTMNQAATGTNTGTTGTFYNTHCNAAATLSGNQNMVSGAAINSLSAGSSSNNGLGC